MKLLTRELDGLWTCLFTQTWSLDILLPGAGHLPVVKRSDSSTQHVDVTAELLLFFTLYLAIEDSEQLTDETCHVFP